MRAGTPYSEQPYELRATRTIAPTATEDSWPARTLTEAARERLH
jgi:hypothetical protein